MFTVQKTLNFGSDDLLTMVIQTAACVIVCCEQREPLLQLGQTLKDPVERVLGEQANWARSACTVGLQAQVSFVHDYVKMVVRDPILHRRLDPSEARIITAALTAYQDWKTAFIAADKALMGPGYEHWGDATEFNRMDWTTLNDRLSQPQPA